MMKQQHSQQEDQIFDLLGVMIRQERTRYRVVNYLQREMVYECQQQQSQYVVEACASITNNQYAVKKSQSSTSLRDVQGDVGNSSPRSARTTSGPLRIESTASPVSDRAVQFSFWRQQMFDWACMVTDCFSIDREVVAASFNLLDRYVARELSSHSSSTCPDDYSPALVSPISREDFQLFSMTCLYIAVKILEPYPRKLSLEALVDMSRGFYTPDDIAVTEREIMTALSWHLHPPTAIGFSRMYWSLLASTDATEPSSAVQTTCATLTELAVANAEFIDSPPSLVGLAATVLAYRLPANTNAHDTDQNGCSAAVHEAQARLLLAKLAPLVEPQAQQFHAIYTQLEALYGN
jgi:hypothetical protein|uniref:Cyclin N-terminal domain-containing protein n=1 Tax=Phaeodactylum tricornutum TaxID=2850 RepID=A0A8J9X8V8_PHATR